MELGSQIENGAEHSPLYSDNSQTWSWNQFGNDINSFGDSSNELCGLVEDKEIAARAVAFVVNSTRKGIVPLCADVANLMRSKQCLERKVYVLRKENEAFRSSASAGSLPSHSMSPIPLSVSSYTESCMKALQEQALGVQDRYRSSSRCSNSSSAYSYSPKMDKPRGGSSRLCGVHYSPASSHESRKHGSPRSNHSTSVTYKDASCRAFFPTSNEQLKVLNKIHLSSCSRAEVPGKETNDESYTSVTCVNLNQEQEIVNSSNSLSVNTRDIQLKTVPSDTNTVENNTVNETTCETSCEGFHIEDETKNDNCEQENDKVAELSKTKQKDQLASENGKQKAKFKSLLERRRVSLPEMTTVPNIQALKIRPKLSKQVQCSLTHADTSAIDQSIEENFVKSVKMNAKLEEELSEAKKEIDQLRKRLKKLESGGAIPKTFVYRDDDKATEDNGYYTGSNRTSRNSSEHERSGVTKKPSPRRQAVTPVTYGGPLPSCRCSSCQEALGSDDDLSHYSDVYLDEPHRYAVNSKLQVQIEDHVITKSNISGCIRYIGHLDKNDLPNTLFVGLELDDPVGSHDGCYMGKRYFYCRPNHGVFVPLNDVINKGSKKAQTKSLREESTKMRKQLKRLTSKDASKDEKFTHL